MKGVVFTEFIEMVEKKFSTSIANRMIDESELPSGGAYAAVGTYDHHEMVSMVAKLSEISGVPAQGLTKDFGFYLFERFCALYPTFFVGETCALDFLAKVDQVIHVEVLKLYPEAELPRFVMERPDSTTLIMTYHSERHFGDLAEGLIKGCIAHFGSPLSLHRENLAEAGNPVRFTICQTA